MRRIPPYFVLAFMVACAFKAAGQAYTVSTDCCPSFVFNNPTPVFLGDNELSEALPIGFDFEFFNTTYSEFYISSNGFITFTDEGDDGCCEGGFIPDPFSPNNLIALGWDDLNLFGDDFYDYETVGSPGDRVLIVTFFGDNCEDQIDGQIWLYEGTNTIELHLFFFSSQFCFGATQGIENADGTDAYFVDGRNADFWDTFDEVVTFEPTGVGGTTDDIGILGNAITYCEGSQEIFTAVQNFGGNVVDSGTVNWEWDGVLQTPVDFNFPVFPGQAFSIDLGNQNLTFGQSYDLKVWTSDPNGVQDTNPANDTLLSTVNVGLGGIYTIGGVSPDYPDFTSAVADLVTYGICDSVTFDVRAGTYTEQIDIPTIQGAFGDRWITFQSDSGDSTDVVLTFNGVNPSENYVLRLENTGRLAFKGITIEAVPSNLGRVVDMSFVENIKFENCVIRGYSPTTGLDYANMHITGSHTNVEIRDCRIVNGSYAVYARADFNEVDARGFQLSGCEIDSFVFRGLNLSRAVNPLISGNHLLGGGPGAVGMYLTDLDSFVVSGNWIVLEQGIDGLYAEDCNGTPDSLGGSFFNNFIATGLNTTRGLYLRNCNDVGIYFNSINHLGSSTTSGALHLFNAFDYTCYNNNIRNSNGGYALYISNGNGVSDHNNYFEEDSALVRRDLIVLSDLAAWQAFSAGDMHSTSVPPGFIDSIDLHTEQPLLNFGGTPIDGIEFDIDGDPRDSNAPDIGGDEFDALPNDCQIASLVSPKVSCSGTEDVVVAVRNLGSNPVNSVNVEWSVGGIAQSAVSSNRMIGPAGGNDTIHVNLGGFSFVADSLYDLQFATSLPNGVADVFPENDTLSRIFSLALSGSYTVGTPVSDFPTIQGAVDILAANGVCDSVEMLIADGVYNTSLYIPEIPGTSPTAPVLFTSLSRDTASVRIVSDDNLGLTQSVIVVDGANNIAFEDLTFEADEFFDLNVLTLEGNTKNIRIERNSFLGTSSDGVDAEAILASGADSSLIVRGNYFDRGSHAVRVYGESTQSRAHDIVVEDNVFFWQLGGGVDIREATLVKVSDNELERDLFQLAYQGLRFERIASGLDVFKNRIRLLTNGQGIYLNNMTSPEGQSIGKVYNNFVTVSNNDGILLLNTSDVELVYNSIYNTSGSSFTYGLRMTGCDSMAILNNIIVANAGRAISTNSLDEIQCDHNNLWSSGAIGLFGSVQQTLSDWQNATGLDANSLSVDPGFNSDFDLHITNNSLNGTAIPVAGIDDDIDDEPRDPISPDIGADEIGTQANDLEIVAMFPSVPFEQGLQNIDLVIRNVGNNEVTSFDVDWIFQDTVQSTFSFSGSIPSLVEDTVTIGIKNFEFVTDYLIKAWTTSPNGEADANPVNDTIEVDSLFAGVKGELSIGGVGSDFDSIAHAVLAMKYGHVLDSVTFRLQDGVYEEAIEFEQFPGMSCETPVVFISDSENRDNVTWSDNGLMGPPVTISGADGLVFKDLTIRGFNSNVIVIQDSAHCNTFDNCRIWGVDAQFGSVDESVVLSNNSFDTANVFINNLILEGSFGVRLISNASNSFETGTRLLNNTFNDQFTRAVYLVRQSGVVLKNNVIQNFATPQGGYMACQFDLLTNGCLIDGNDIRLEGDVGTGLYVLASTGNEDSRFLISNNFITVGENAPAVGIRLDNSTYVDIVHNSVRITGTNTGSIGAWFRFSTDLRVLNNIFVNEAGGAAMSPLLESYLSVSDHNNFLTTGSNLVQTNTTNYEDLTSWQVTGFDLNSISDDPQFIGGNDLHVQSAMLDGAATPVASVTLDIDGQSRDTVNPDIGADEFSLVTDDVGLISINYPSVPFPSGLNTVFIKFSNNGGDTLTSMLVDWEVDGIAQPTYIWAGLLGSGETYDSLDIGTFDFVPGVAHTLKVWVSAPNGETDGLAANDTLSVQGLYPGLVGTYTIGGDDPDFETIGAAVAELDSGGVAGPVLFNIRDGVYLETISISDYPGGNCDASVIFQSESMDSSRVTITNLGVDAHVLTLDGADGITFRHLTLESVNPAFRTVVEYYGGADCNTFSNNHLKGFQDNSSSFLYSVIYSQDDADLNNIFENNLITGGSYSIHIRGQDARLSGTIIRNNKLIDPYAGGISATLEDGIIIENNFVTSELYSSFYGISVLFCDSAYVVSGNNVVSDNGFTGIYVDNCDASDTARSLIVNNFASVGGGTTSTNAILLSNSTNTDVFYNSAHNYSEGTSTASNSAMLLGNMSSVNILNNVLQNSSPGGPVMSIINSSITNSDHNCLHNQNSSAYIEFNGNTLVDLGGWQSLTGFDANSVASDPQFTSDTDLHARLVLLNGAALPIAGISTDIDGEVRDPVAPDIGADEFIPAASDDAGVMGYIGPIAPFAPGRRAVTVALKNFGGDTLSSAEVRWLINGEEQTPFQWTGSLAPGACDTISLDSFNFAPVLGYDLLVWSESPNGVTDSTNVNDTLAVNDIYAGLLGTYTVGGSLPDFNLLSQVESALRYGGILGHVEFSVRPGTYDTQLEIDDFPRVNNGDSVIFRSELNDPLSVNITRTSPGLGHTVLLDRAMNIGFKAISFESITGNAIVIDGGSRNILIENCRVLAPLFGSGVNQSGIYSPSSIDNNVRIKDSHFQGGVYGINLSGAFGLPERGLVIQDCSFEGQFFAGVRIVHSRGCVVEQNMFTVANQIRDAFQGFSLDSTFRIAQNDIRFTSRGGTAMLLANCRPGGTDRAAVVNNHIEMIGCDVAAFGIHCDAIRNIDFSFNTVRIENSNSISVPFTVVGSNDGNNDVRNCIFANLSGNYAVDVGWQAFTTNNTMDYNNLYSVGSPLIDYFVDYDDLQEHQLETGANLNSISVDPIFTKPSGYEVAQAGMNGAAVVLPSITTDIEGITRDATSPDIGAYEFTPFDSDLAAVSLSSPSTFCGLSSSESVQVIVQNRGGDAQSNFDVGYRLVGGNWVIENVNSTVLPGTVYEYTFASQVDLSTVATYEFEIAVFLTGDEDTSNDTLVGIQVEHIPQLVATPENLLPLNNSVNLDRPVSLSWSPTQDATRYDVYVWEDGTTPPSDPQVEGIPQINRSYNGVDYGTKYNWFVSARNTCDQTTRSDTLTFTIRDLPDLVVDTVIAPLAAFSGQDIEVEWIVENIGDGGTQSQVWTDAVYLSTDATLNTSFDIYLGGVQNLTALDSGQAYLQSFEVTLPQDAVGNYFLIVNTNRFNNLIESENNNNWERSQVVTQVSLTPPPDLVVSAVAAPSLALSGATIDVQYTVLNQGAGSTKQAFWYNRVILSSDPFNPVGNQLALVPFNGELLPDSSDTQTVQVELPQGIQGEFYIFVAADDNNDVFEFGSDGNNFNFSDSLTIILAPTPDLIVDTVFIPDSVSSDVLLGIGWKVTNQGGGPTVTNYWRDEIYLSASPVFNNNFNNILTSAFHSTTVASLDSYERFVNARIPKLEEGEYYVYSFTDKDDREYEFDKESNNIGRLVNTITVLNPDLIPGNFAYPDTVTANTPFQFQFDQLNIGNGSYVDKQTYTRIYASNQPEFDPEDQLIIQFSEFGSMGAGDTLRKNLNLNLPPSLGGSVYLHVAVDHFNAVFEGSADTNNIQTISTPLLLLEGPIPDLEVRGLTYPDTILAGISFDLSYDTYNNGFGTAEGPWREELYISFDSIWNEENAILLNSSRLGVDLVAGDTVGTSLILDLEDDFVENKYYFYVVLDAQDDIFEGSGEQDNVFRSDILCVRGAPKVDLAVDSVSIDTSGLVSGGRYQISWKASVVNGALPIINDWEDAVYLSSDAFLDTAVDIRIGTLVTSADNFGPSDPLSRTDLVTFPDGLSGTYYLFVYGDVDNFHSDTNQVNNVGVVRDGQGNPLQINVELAAYPDLSIEVFVAPDQIIAGQPTQIQLKITNIGSGSTLARWRDRVYLSTDEAINVGDLLLIDETRFALASGQSVVDTFDVTVPINFSGNYLLIASTDQGRTVFEFGGEDNNEAQRTVELILPPPPDLVVEDVVIPLEGVAGELATVSWQTENIGVFPAQGSFREVVYLSLDTIWDISDVLFGVSDLNVYLPPAGTRMSNLTAPLANVFSDEYFAIVQTDALNNFAESDETNNYTSSLTPIDIDIKSLFIDSLTSDTLFDLQELYYKVEVTPDLEGETMIISIDGDSLNGINELYASFGNIPSRAEFDYTYDIPFSGQQRVVIPSLQVGTYYILGYGSSVVSSSQEVELLARIVPFQIESVSPRQGVTNTQVTVEIRGIKLDNTSKFRLRQNNPWFELIADTVFVFSDNRVYATFDLTNVAVDTYALDVLKADSSLAFIDDFMVIPDGEPDIQFNVTAPGSVPSRRIPVKIVVTYQNIGSVDAFDPRITIDAPYGNGIARTLRELRDGNFAPTITIPLVEQNGPSGILRPGAAGIIEVFAWSSPAPTFVAGLVDE